MTPLEQHLLHRTAGKTSWGGLHRCFASTLPPLGRVIERRIWPRPLRHMRSIAPGYQFETTADGTWKMTRRGEHAVTCRPLLEIIGNIDRPVSIIASGPSSHDCDWARLKQENRLIVAVNGATTLLAKHAISPDLHVVTDRQFARTGTEHFDNSPHVPIVTSHRAISILHSINSGMFNHKPVALVERINAWYGIPSLNHATLRPLCGAAGDPFYFPEQNEGRFSVGWSMRPDLGIFSGCTVTFAALQILIGLGAKEIEIIGMDLNDRGRAYQEGPKAQPSLLMKEYEKFILPSFQMMHQALRNTDVFVRNLSPVCPLPRGLFAESP